MDLPPSRADVLTPDPSSRAPGRVPSAATQVPTRVVARVAWLRVAAPLAMAAPGCGDDEATPAASATDSDGGGTGGTTAGSSTAASSSPTATGETTGMGSTTTGATTADASTSAPTSTTESATTGTDTDFVPGEPLDPAPDLQWTYLEIPGAVCRDGSPAGFAYRLNAASDDLVIYFEGGGACYNNATCVTNPAMVGEGSKGGRSTGLFDVTDERNPLRTYNWVYIPYCTGDVFAGTRPDGDVFDGPQDQQFVGYLNVGLFLQRIVPTFSSASQVVVTGESAGGFGASINYHRIARLFIAGGSQVTLIDDSGPAMDDAYMPACLQQQWRDVWGMDGAFPADCEACFGSDGGGLVNYYGYLVDTFPGQRFGLISATRDEVIRSFFGFGLNDCRSLLPAYPAAQFEEGLYDVIDNWIAVAPTAWGAFAVDSDMHTWLSGSYYTVEVDGLPLYGWVDAMINGTPTIVDPR